ncbi:hypothetical protein GCM10007884_15010 [Methylobacterium brachythecii]|uniref:Uncharacterized protein n=1 Tax=Methylobacterium brachythecii TaxID=1176177 RepID=A0ABQ6D0F2_9HYPH|nr:hypothetical protein GCM10007884_15010 [Methylobacterium brachythecii]
MSKTEAGIDHDIRPKSFFGIRHLLGDDRIERGLRHTWASEYSSTLHLRRSADNKDRITAFVGTGFEKKRNIENDK